MKKVIILLMIGLWFTSACKTKPKTTVKSQEEQVIEKVEPVAESVNEIESASYIYITFFSIGAGTDGKTRTQMLEFLDTYQKEKGLELSINAQNWGREGEVDYCINTTTLNNDISNELYDNLQKIFNGKELIKMKRANNCKSRK